VFSVADIEKATQKLKLGKTAGDDKLTAENVIHAHPIFISCMVRLFNLMLSCGYVPNDFGVGIMIHLLKDANSDASLPENCRCLTISSVLL